MHLLGVLVTSNLLHGRKDMQASPDHTLPLACTCIGQDKQACNMAQAAVIAEHLCFARRSVLSKSLSCTVCKLDRMCRKASAGSGDVVRAGG